MRDCEPEYTSDCVRLRERECERECGCVGANVAQEREKKKTRIRVLLSKDRAIFQNFTHVARDSAKGSRVLDNR